MTVADVKGVKLAGLMFDAGPVNSPVLLQVGTQHAANGQAREHNQWSDPADPTSLQDVFFRIGGATPGKATTSLVVNSDNVLLDNIWAWRADHGNGVGWTDQHRRHRRDRQRRQRHGVRPVRRALPEVRAHLERRERPDDLLPERDAVRPAEPGGLDARRRQRLRRLQGGRLRQDARGLGHGQLLLLQRRPGRSTPTRGFEVPVTAGVKLHDILTVFLNGNGGIDHVVNDTGAAVNATNQVTNIVSYP